MNQIDITDYAGDILKALAKGILLTTKAGDKVNSMAIGWGTLGINWGKPVFAVYVRESRFTREQLDKNPEYTINVPMGDYDGNIIAVCGMKSGRDTDKIAEAGLTLIDPQIISVPAIKEFPLTLECKVIYRQPEDLEQMPADIVDKLYPQDVPSTDPMANRDCHVTYYGEIVAAYIAG